MKLISNLSFGSLRRLFGGPAGSTLLQGLISYWPLNELSGVRYDAVGDNDLTDNNTVGVKLRGPQGTVAKFDHANFEWLSRPSPLGIHGGAVYTCGWVKGPLSPMNAGLWGENVTNNGPFSLYTYSSAFSAKFHPVAEAEVNLSIYPPTMDNLYHFVEAYFQPGVAFGIAVDGGAFVTTPTAATALVSAGEPFWIGAYYTSFYTITAEMAGIGVWSVVPDAAARTSLFNSGNGLKYADLSDSLKTGLVSWWELDETSGVRYDSHGSNDLTDNNTVGSVNTGPLGTVSKHVAANNEVLSGGSVNGQTEMTVNFWADVTADGRAFNIDAEGAAGNQRLLVASAGGIVYFFDESGAYTTVGYAYPPRFVMVTFTVASDKKLRVYEDGVLVVTSAALATPNFASNASLTFGGALYANTTATYGTSGRFAAAGLWNVALDAAALTSLFNSGLGKRYADLTVSEKVGLVSYWNLDEVSGVRYDSHGSNDLTDNNTVGSVINAGDAMDGGAASFVAANSEYLRSDVCQFSGATAVSVGAWFRVTGTGGTYPAIIDTGIIGRAFEVYFGNSGQELVYLGFTNSSGLATNGPYTIVRDRWYWLYASYDDGNWACYLDNVLQGSGAHGSGALVASAELEIGGPFYSGSYINGQVDEVAIWDRVLTTDERAELFALGKGKFYAFN